MNYPCGLIRDLLPLYHDDICSPESRSAIEAHCSECADCKKILEALGTAPEPQANIQDAAPLLPIQKRWEHEKKRSLWIGLGIALLLLLVIVGHAVLTEWYCIPMGKDDIVLMDLYQTSDGMIHIILCRRRRLISPLRHRS